MSDLNREEIIGTFYQKKLQKTNQKRFRTEKIIKVINYMLNGKDTIILSIAAQIKKTQCKLVNIFQNQIPQKKMKKLNYICLIMRQKQIKKFNRH